jgi:subtilisin family serine protease
MAVDKITINGITVDTEVIAPTLHRSSGPAAAAPARGASTPTLRTEREISPASDDATYLLIRTSSPITKDQRSQLVGLGVELLEYVAPQTLMARGHAGAVSQIRRLAFVAWAGPYVRDFKIDSHLVDALRDGQSRSVDAVELPAGEAPVPFGADDAAAAAAARPRGRQARQERDQVEGQHLVDVLLHQGVSGEQAAGDVVAAAGVARETLSVGARKVRLLATAAQIEAITRLECVRHIELVPNMGLANDVAIRITTADLAHSTFGRSGRALDGSGQVIAVADTGFDRGSTSDVHPAFRGRVKRLYALGRRDCANDPEGHGTHVAGSIAAAAPAATLVVQSLIDSVNKLAGIPLDLADLFSLPYVNDNVRVHNNSWTSDAAKGAYTAGAREIDEFISHHRDMVVCVAAGNRSRDSSFKGVVDLRSVDAPGTAKNCITVGASESLRLGQGKTYAEGFPDRFAIPPIGNDLWANSSDGLAAFSGRGPTGDGRIKPDLVAPGTSILSARSRAVANPDPFWGTSEDPLYCYRGGTSMATPIVCGCAAIVRQYLIEERGIKLPSAALVKAMLINGAVHLVGHYVPSESGPRPSFNQGFGRVNLARSLCLTAGETIEIYDEDKMLEEPGEEQSFAFVIPERARSISVTLVWTDSPGERLVHDLDLIVRVADAERHGNVPAGSPDFDRVNNVEEVTWMYPPSGMATAAVRAYDLGIASQNFALVIRISANT